MTEKLDAAGLFIRIDGEIILNQGELKGEKASDNLSFVTQLLNDPTLDMDSREYVEEVLAINLSLKW